MNYNFINILLVNEDFFSKFSSNFVKFVSNIDQIIPYLIWGLLFIGIFNILWAFFLRLNRDIKTSELVSRLTVAFILFYVVYLILTMFSFELL